MSEILSTVLISIATTGVGGFFGWLFGRKEANVRIKGEEINNFDRALDAYKKMYEDIIEDLKTQVNELKDENTSLKEEVSENRKQLMTLTNFVLAFAIKRADSTLDEAAFSNLKEIIK